VTFSTRTVRTALVLAAVAVAGTGCVDHIAPYKAKRRTYDGGTFGRRPTATDGSLYAAGSPGLFEDKIAGQLGDILVIRIEERDLATQSADTKLDRQDATSYGLPAAIGLLGALKAKYPDVDPAALFSSTSSQKFAGNGATQRKGMFSATLPVRVMQVLDNGDLFVEGTKVTKVGAEEHHIYMSGVVRRIDIAEDNTVPSSRVADAEIEYVGRGDITDTQRRGWLSRILSKVWPF
jgi:flagellar L-ring protein FlgH